nr:RpiB/LacA/LacB family sugar-phosphate isomerase [Mycoplasmopsis bovis]
MDANLAKLHNNANVIVMGGRQVNINQAKAIDWWVYKY